MIDRSEAVQAAYRAWRKAAEKGYGNTTSYADMKRIDANIRRLKTKYENLVQA
jgi:hypothetical protein